MKRLLLVSWMAFGCSLDMSGKDRCARQEDCALGFTCQSTQCVPCGSTAADTTGLTSYDTLCSAGLDGSKWVGTGAQGGAYAFGVENGAAVMSAGMRNQSPSSGNASYNALANVAVTGGHRVTTLAVDMVVPSGVVSASGMPEMRAVVRLIYQPPARRLAFPGANQDILFFEAGLLADGNGIRAFRQATHCDDPACLARTNSAVTFTDPSGWTPSGRIATAPAAYDVTYRVTVSLDETAGMLRFIVAGGGFGPGGASGTIDPSAYLAATPAWMGVPLAAGGFFVAQLGVRVLDDAPGGGSSGAITARFDNVQVGLDNGAATAWDDFGGVGDNSGPSELSLRKWSNGGQGGVDAPAGSLALRSRATGVGAATTLVSSLLLVNPAAVSTLQTDVTIASASGSVSTADPRVLVEGHFYNDGFAGSTAPNVNGANSSVGDVLAGVILRPLTQTAEYQVVRCRTATCLGATDPIANGTLADVTIGPGVHSARVRWDAVAQRFTFTVDARSQVVDPTGSAPVVSPANAPVKRIATALALGGTIGETASIEADVNNVFVAP
jgi:hypothetical protein